MPDSDEPPPIHGLGYARPIPRPSRKKHVIEWVVAGWLMFAWAAVIVRTLLHTAVSQANRVGCTSNLKIIGNALLLYANDHGGRFPDTIGALMEEDITTTVFICPYSSDTAAAAGATTRASAANVESAGHCSYIYVGKGLTNALAADVILAYEPLSNHQNAGMNVLFGDMHVDFLQRKDANWALSELKAGYNPPRDQKTMKQPGR